MKRGNIAAALLPAAAALMKHCRCRRTAADANATLLPSCRQAAAVAYVLCVLVVVVSIAIATAAFSSLLIVGSAPAIAVAAGVFVATVAVRGSSAAPATLLPPLTL